MQSLFTSNKVRKIHRRRQRVRGGLHDRMRFMLFTGKFFGFLPLVGFKTHETLRFTWKSAYVLLCLFTIFVEFFLLCLQVHSFMISAFNIQEIIAIIYFCMSGMLSLLLFRFCKRYKKFIADIEAIENLLPPPKKPRFSVRFINNFAGSLLLLAVVEHILYILDSLYLTHECYINTEDGPELLETYFTLVYPWYFDVFPFSYVAAAIFQFLKFQAAIIWPYADTIIINHCIYLRNRFQQYNELIFNKHSMYTTNFKPNWSELQVYYTRLSILVSIVDKNINSLVFVSYASSLYFLCLNMYFLLNQLAGYYNEESEKCVDQHRNDVLHVIFKIINLFSLLMRNSTISHLAAEVNVDSRKPLMVLHTTPSVHYDRDMRRLMSQIYYSKISITGLNFFQITRGMMLAMVAKLLTYEIVLIQF